MKYIICVGVLFMNVITISADEIKRTRINSYIAQNVTRYDQLLFFIDNNQNHSIITTRFNVGTNILVLSLGDKKSCISSFISPPPRLALPVGTSFWHTDKAWIEFNDPIDDETPNEFNALEWFCGGVDGKFSARTFIYLWTNLSINDFRSEFDKKNSINLKIAKIIDEQPLTFAFIVTNDTDKPIKFPDFFTAENLLKIKFPDGKIYTHPIIEKTEKLTIAPGQCRYVIFDLAELLKNDSEFSLKNFDFGLSELQWELRKPNGEVITEIFHLIKFNGDLPSDNGEGYHLLAPPTPATFRDKLIKVLPPEVIE